MARSKSTLIKDYFSENPLYLQSRKYGFRFVALVVALSLASLVLALLNSADQPENNVLSVVRLVLPFVCIAALLAAAYLIISSFAWERNARIFIDERIRDRYTGIEERAFAAASQSSDIALVLPIAGYTSAVMPDSAVFCLVDEQNCFFSTSYQAAVLFVAAGELFCYSETAILYEPDTIHRDLTRIPLGMIKSISREQRLAQVQHQRAQLRTTSYPYLCVCHADGIWEASLAHYDLFDSGKNQFFPGIEQRLQDELKAFANLAQ